MDQITDCLEAAKRAVATGDMQRARVELNVALALAQAYTNPSMVKHRVLRGNIAQAMTALGMRDRRMAFLNE